MSEGVSVLAQMAAATMTEKVKVSRTLSPVGAETPTTHRDPAGVPNDLPGMYMSREQVIESIKVIRAQIAVLTEAADAMDALLEVSTVPAVVVDPLAEQKAAEAEADRKARVREGAEPAKDDQEAAEAAVEAGVAEPADFGAAYAKKMAEAQAAVFPDKDAVETLDADGQETLDDGWTCPEHGRFQVSKSKKGREYRTCPEDECKEFERL